MGCAIASRAVTLLRILLRGSPYQASPLMAEASASPIRLHSVFISCRTRRTDCGRPCQRRSRACSLSRPRDRVQPVLVFLDGLTLDGSFNLHVVLAPRRSTRQSHDRARNAAAET